MNKIREFTDLKKGIVQSMQYNALINTMSKNIYSNSLYSSVLKDPAMTRKERFAGIADFTEKLVRSADRKILIQGYPPALALKETIDAAYDKKIEQVENAKGDPANLMQNIMEISLDSKRMAALRKAPHAFRASCAYMCSLFWDNKMAATSLYLTYRGNEENAGTPEIPMPDPGMARELTRMPTGFSLDN